MIPVTLRTDRLVLNQPRESDRVAITEYCRDPLFEAFMTLPWPYELEHADYFIADYAPKGWATNVEYTWAIRESEEGPLIGVISWRRPRGDIGYWLGAPYRGRGIMGEALAAIIDFVFALPGVQEMGWECVVGNTDSASVARAAGFRFTGEAPSVLVFRDGSHPLAWHGVLERGSTGPKEGWPL